jgi:hypothetical protein
MRSGSRRGEGPEKRSRSAKYRLVALVSLCVPLLSLGAWHQSAVGGSPEGAGVSLVLKANKATYTKGEPLALTLQVVNQSPRAVRLHFRDAQRYDVVVQDAQGGAMWRWSASQMFAQVRGEESLQPAGGQLTYRITVRQRFPPGHYTVVGIIPAEDGPFSASINIRIE